MSEREQWWMVLCGFIIGLFTLVSSIGYWQLKVETIKANAKIQVAHEINIGLTNFGQIWNKGNCTIIRGE